MESVSEETSSAFPMIEKETATNAFLISSFSTENVSKKTNTAFHTAREVDATNVRTTIMSVPMEFAFPKNLDVFIKEESVNIANFLSKCTQLPKNAELTDAWKPELKAVSTVNTHSSQLTVSVKSHTVTEKKTEPVSNVTKDTT